MMHKKSFFRMRIVLFSLFLVTILPVHSFPLPAFPGAEGFGSETPGGRGGQVIEVTNLNDSGSGSFRAACEASGPRIVVFRTGGTIGLESGIKIKNPYITIAGQTAPGGGITFRAHPAYDGTPIQIETRDVVIRCIRVRRGPSKELSVNGDALLISSGGHDVIIDHCSFSWSTDEMVNSWYDAHDFTFQWCVFSEALYRSTHKKGAHSMGPLFGDHSRNISFHHNLLAHNTQRNPQLTSYVETIIQVINNVVYNWAYKGCYFSNKPNANVIGNYFRRGPDTRQQRYEIGLSDFTGRIYVKDNLGPHRQKQGMDNWAVVGTGENHKDPAPSSYQALKPFPAPRITVQPVMEAYQLVIQSAGSMIPSRDAVDKRILQDVKDGTGRIIDDPSDVGGWPVLSAGTPREDTDHDGMPDAWEVAHDLDPRDSSDANGKDLSPEGYTNIEMFLNGLMIQGP